MEINYLKEYVKLMELGSYSKAAEKLSISQSVLSKHMKAIETEVGMKLIDKKGWNISTSDYGRIFLPYAREIAMLYSGCEEALYNYRNNIISNLRIGMLSSLYQYNCMQKVYDFIKNNPKVNLDLVEGTSGQMLKQFREGKTDISIIREIGHFPISETQQGEQSLRIDRDYICAILPKEHPFADKTTITMEDLRYESFISFSEESVMYAFTKEIAQRAGFEADIVYTSNSVTHILEMVRRRVGIALLNDIPCRNTDMTDLVMIPLNPVVHTYISVYYHEDKSPVVQHFIAGLAGKGDGQSWN